MIDFYASQPHYLDHMAPIWHALPERDRGRFGVADYLLRHTKGSAHGIQLTEYGHLVGDVRCVAGWQDAMETPSRIKLALMEHGVGQTYSDIRVSAYAGGLGRDRVDVFLCPNDRVREINERANPRADSVVIGSPRMDEWFTWPEPDGWHPLLTVQCTFAFHWDCDLNPETLSAFRHYRDWVPDIARTKAIGVTAHPRNEQVRPWSRRMGVPWAVNADAVFSHSACLAADNTSLLYEFAALDRPVIVLNAPWYRADVTHGLRFWDMADVGIQVNHPAMLDAAIDKALEDPSPIAERRREITAELFPVRDGTASTRAAGVLRALQSAHAG
jgi:hypothetical protein